MVDYSLDQEVFPNNRTMVISGKKTTDLGNSYVTVQKVNDTTINDDKKCSEICAKNKREYYINAHNIYATTIKTMIYL